MDNFKDALKLLKIDDALIDQLKSTQHGDIEKSPNHLEGDVFTHTEMVFKAGQRISDRRTLVASTILHDIGKPECRGYENKNNPSQVTFYGHGFYSTIKSIPYLKKYLGFLPYQKSINTDSIQDFLTILYAINYHMILMTNKNIQNFSQFDNYFGFGNWVYQYMYSLYKADNLGRITHYVDQQTRFPNWMLNEPKNSFGYFGDINIDNPLQFTISNGKYNENKSDVIFAIGVPGSGKTTWINNYCSHLGNISRDTILSEMYPSESYSKSWNMANHSLVDKEYSNRFDKLVENKKSLVIDKTNVQRNGREKTIKTLNGEFNNTALVFLTPIDEINTRNNAREDKNLVRIADGMMKRFMLPTFGEGFSKITFIL